MQKPMTCKQCHYLATTKRSPDGHCLRLASKAVVRRQKADAACERFMAIEDGKVVFGRVPLGKKTYRGPVAFERSAGEVI